MTVDVPLPLLRVLDSRRLEWLIPGWLREKVVLLLRGLPKDIRREIVPIPDTADRFMAGLGTFGEGSLFESLAAFVTQAAGKHVEPGQVAAAVLPPWLQFNVRVVDHGGHALRSSRDLAALREEFRAHVGSSIFAQAKPDWERTGLRAWDFGDLPAEIALRSAGVQLRAYPGLQDDGASVRLRLFSSAAAAQRATRRGVVRLAALALAQQHDLVRRQLAADHEFSLLVAATGFGKELLAEVADRAIADAVLGPARLLPATRAEFDALLEAGRSQRCRSRRRYRADGAQRAQCRSRSAKPARNADARRRSLPCVTRSPGNCSNCSGPGWVRTMPDGWWTQLPKYVRALSRRLERARGDVARDAKVQALVAPYEAFLRKLVAAADGEKADPERERLRWMIEEYRLSLFAQDMKTLLPISAKRLDEQVLLAQREAGLAPVGVGVAVARGGRASGR